MTVPLPWLTGVQFNQKATRDKFWIQWESETTLEGEINSLICFLLVYFLQLLYHFHNLFLPPVSLSMGMSWQANTTFLNWITVQPANMASNMSVWIFPGFFNNIKLTTELTHLKNSPFLPLKQSSCVWDSKMKLTGHYSFTTEDLNSAHCTNTVVLLISLYSIIRGIPTHWFESIFQIYCNIKVLVWATFRN